MDGLRFTPVALLICAAGVCQQPAEQRPTLQVNVNLVQVEAVVTDTQGRHVPGLSAGDFRLQVDGQPRKITHFSFVDTAGDSASQAWSPGKPLREQIHRTVVFMVDETHTTPENLTQLTPVVHKFLDEQVRPGDLVSVMAVRTNLGIYEQFSSDRQKIRAALDRLVRLAGQSYNHINQQDRPIYSKASLIEMSNAYFMETYHGMTMASLSRAIEALRDMPGRKAIFLLSDGIEFPLFQLNIKIDATDPTFIYRMRKRTREVADLANQAGVSLYTIDTKNLMLPDLSPERAASMEGVPYFLAKETGGIFAHNTNDLNAALDKAMKDMAGYYVLGFAPAPNEAEDKRWSDRNHRLRVTVTPAGLRVRTRSGFHMVPDGGAPAEQSNRRTLMEQALFSPFAGGGIQIHLNPLYSASPPDPKTKARRTLLRVQLSIEGRDLRFSSSDNGRKKGVVDVVVAAYDSNDRAAGSRDQRYTLDLSEEQAAALTKSGLHHQVDLVIPKPGNYQVRAAVRDDTSGTVGSAAAFLEIPDFNRHLALSSLVLESVKTAAEATGTTAAKTFKLGSGIQYACRIYGAATGPPPASAPKVDVELHLFRDGAQVFAGSPIALSSEPQDREITVLGSFTVPTTFSEGDYTMQLVAYDRRSGSRQVSAVQSVQLTLVR